MKINIGLNFDMVFQKNIKNVEDIRTLCINPGDTRLREEFRNYPGCPTIDQKFTMAEGLKFLEKFMAEKFANIIYSGSCYKHLCCLIYDEHNDYYIFQYYIFKY